jgi:hypothetical protein
VNVPRGKKKKMKKMKEKYGWQDEEDRKLHMAMLGVRPHFSSCSLALAQSVGSDCR